MFVSLLLVSHHITAIRERRPIRRQQTRVQDNRVLQESGGEFLDASTSMAAHNFPGSRSTSLLPPASGRLNDNSSIDGAVDDPLNMWLSNISDRYNHLGIIPDPKATGDKSVSSRGKRKSRLGKNGSEVKNHVDSDLNTDPVDTWVSNIFDRYDLPGNGKSSKIIRHNSKHAFSGKASQPSHRTDNVPVDDWLSNVLDQHGVSAQMPGENGRRC